MTEQPSDTWRPDFSTGTFARVTGKVQGVNYRNNTKSQADDLELTGWVRNTSDGAVEVLVGGAGPAVDSLLRWCRSGPKRAVVDDVASREASPEELETLPETGFIVRR